jgi:oxygen-independent coproporphyrinogen-3 oxidase
MEKYGYSWGKLQTVYLGGGTPSLWGIEGISFLREELKKRGIQYSENYEFTLEVNPKTWTKEILDAWIEFGVNRFSIGVQTLNANLVSYLDRLHSHDDIINILRYFNSNKLNFSVDFMLGLPNSEKFKRNVVEELELIEKYSPNHYSVYILTVKENYPHLKSIPSEEWIEGEFLDVSSFLQSIGYNHYEISNFSRPNKQSNHNMRYWESKTVAALGPSATGYFREERIRYKWQIKEPTPALEYLTDSEFKMEEIYMLLRTSVGLDLQLMGHEFRKVASSWVDRNLAKIENDKIRLNSKGFLVLDSLMGELFALKLL